ncbi:MAG: hypothetical protein B7Y40_00400 [Gammaproteobacteria bacterium 28-57-27]|nr:MAG: hypothetical protein B7Y40_00400 [Gammaproteobacteria bacterium 28-57-27]
MKIDIGLFDSSSFPLDSPVVVDSARPDSEGIAMEKVFPGKGIKDITTEVLIEGFKKTDLGAIPFFMTDMAFVFFLPALMQASIDGQEDNNNLLPPNLLFELGEALTSILLKITKEGEKNNLFRMLNSTYSHEQKREIARFLVEMRDYNPDYPDRSPEEALQKYWGKFL